LLSGEGDCDPAYLEGLFCLAVSDDGSGKFKRIVRCDREVEFSECLFDQGDPESPVSVECAVKIEDDAPRWQRAISG
jgi:hypothetical protein